MAGALGGAGRRPDCGRNRAVAIHPTPRRALGGGLPARYNQKVPHTRARTDKPTAAYARRAAESCSSSPSGEGTRAGRRGARGVGGMDRLTVLCFAGTYSLALLAELARPVARGAGRWYLALGLTA